MAAVGPWLVFVLNVLSYFGILAVLVRWKREHRKSALPAERFLARSGLNALRHAYPRAAIGARARYCVFCFASATWSLFPLIVRRELGRAECWVPAHLYRRRRSRRRLVLPRVRARLSRDTLVAGASALYALAALALAYVQSIGLLAVAMLATGVAWISILSALQVAAQMTLPAWVRARGLAAFVVVFMGGMALGSILWGQVATRIGIPAARSLSRGRDAAGDRADLPLPARSPRRAQLHPVDALAAAGVPPKRRNRTAARCW